MASVHTLTFKTKRTENRNKNGIPSHDCERITIWKRQVFWKKWKTFPVWACTLRNGSKSKLQARGQEKTRLRYAPNKYQIGQIPDACWIRPHNYQTIPRCFTNVLCSLSIWTWRTLNIEDLLFTALEKITTNIENSTRPNQWAAEDIDSGNPYTI